jgi:hypothetical protein
MKALVVLGVCLLLAGCSGEKQIEDSIRDATPDQQVSARALSDAYQDDARAADKQYKDLVLLVTGQISSMGTDLEGRPYVNLKGGMAGQSVQCLFAPGNSDRLANLSAGDEIVVKGRCDAVQLQVRLRGCVMK